MSGGQTSVNKRAMTSETKMQVEEYKESILVKEKEVTSRAFGVEDLGDVKISSDRTMAIIEEMMMHQQLP